MLFGSVKLKKFWSAGAQFLLTFVVCFMGPFFAQSEEIKIRSCEALFSSPRPRLSIQLDHVIPVEVKLGSFPSVHPNQIESLYTEEYEPTTSSSSRFNFVRELIEFAGDGMNEQRGWGTDFNRYRMQAAMKYSKQSSYIDIWSIDWENRRFEDQERRGTMGLTIARAATAKTASEQIPMHDIVDDEDGKSWKLALNKAQAQAGQIYEARTYRLKDTEIKDKMLARSLAMSWVYNQVKKSTEDNPQVRDLPIIYTYGDRKSVRMYRKLGFELLTAEDGFPPLKKWNQTWYALRVSPNQLVKDHRNLSGTHSLLTDAASALVTRSGRTILTSGAIYYSASGVEMFQVLERTNVAPGVWIPADGAVSIASDGSVMLHSVEGDLPGENAKIADIEVQRNSLVRFNSDGVLVLVGSLGKDIKLADLNLSLPKESILMLNDEGELIAATVMADYEIFPGVQVTKGSRFFVERSQSTTTFKIALTSEYKIPSHYPAIFGIGHISKTKINGGIKATLLRDGRSMTIEHSDLSPEELRSLGLSEK